LPTRQPAGHWNAWNYLTRSGDNVINLDGRVDVGDLLLMQQALTDEITLGLAPAWHADLYPAGGGDGELNIADLLALQTLIKAP